MGGSRRLVGTIAAALGVLALAFGTWVATRPANDSGQDLPIYEEYASMILDGQLPYRDFRIEYPPGALPMFVLTALTLSALRRPPHAQALSLAVVASSPLVIGHVFVERYDIWPAALTAAALAAAVRGRYRLGGA